MSARRSNVLMIVTDQERPWALLPKGLKLPGRERIAERATHFTQFHVSGTICSPCRSVLYTGQHWQATGIFDNIQRREVKPFPPEVPTLGTMFQALGYRTAYRGKWHISFLDAQMPGEFRCALQPFGFETYSELPDINGAHDGYTRDPVVTSETQTFLAESAHDERPWFLAVNFINPHDIMFYRAWNGQTQKLDFSRVRGAPDDPLYADYIQEDAPPNFGPASLAGKPPAIARNIEAYDYMLGAIPWDRPEPWLAYRQYYYNCMRDVDCHVAAVLDALEESGQADNTIIVFTSDHGEMAGAHGLRDKGSACYRELISVPFLVSHPDMRSPRESTALVSQVDVAPTLLSLVGVNERGWRDRYPGIVGLDLSGALAGGEGPREDKGVLLNVGNIVFLDPAVQRRQAAGMPAAEAFASRDLSLRGMARGIYDGRYKFVRWFAANDHHIPYDFELLLSRNDIELYDTAADPYEIVNLGATPQRFRALLTTLSEKCNSLIAAEIGHDDGCIIKTS